MSILNRYIILFIIFIISVFTLFYLIDIYSEKMIEHQKQILLKQAQTLFGDQVTVRKWNAKYGGLYVKPLKGQKPNPYLQNNTLKVDNNLTLFKINPALMTKQLSEISDVEDFHFKITSLTPVNPNNKAIAFEERALKYIEKTNKKEYYELNENSKFNYMGALITEKHCLSCHKNQGYKIGNIKGGIHFSLNTTEYEKVISSIKSKTYVIKIFTVLFLLSIVLLIYARIKTEIYYKTKEIESTKQLLEQIMDTEKNFIVLADGKDVIYANKAILEFFNHSSIDKFKENYEHMSDIFEKVADDKKFLQTYNNGYYWIDYLKKEQNSKDLKVLVKTDDKNRYFKPYAIEIKTDDKILDLIKFDEITDEYIQIKELEEKASTDPLTKLFNRSKLNDVLEKEMALSHAISSPLSIIFLDIDHFKPVNDTYGHHIGDQVLIEIANIINSVTRVGDFAVRWGGEEFMITLQSTDTSHAERVAEKLRITVQKHEFNTTGKLTISLGVTEYQNNESQESFIKRVDEALYEAKESGRNRVVVK